MARRARAGSRRARGGVSVNFEGVESRWMGPERSYVFKVVSGESYEDDQVKFNVECVKPEKFEGKKTTMFFSLKEQALWKLRAFLEALGVDVPNSEYELEFQEYEDMEFGADMMHHEYDGNVYFRAAQFFPADDYEDDEDDDKSDRKPKKTRDEDEDKPSRRRGREKDEDGSSRGKRGRDKDEDKDDDKSSRGRSSRRSKKEDDELEKLAAADVEDMSEDELEDVVQKYELDVDLDKARTLKRKATMVIDALEAAEMLEEE